ncbi:TrbC/VirB2 family protein [Campylobacter fetus subsp. venerealis]|uniref:TraC protein n=1 Tax=Campylobacter hyointestinalis subsp. hyointestinalis TaxID=91352 RepID=A0A9W5AQT4_CAMHY|nr:MULTISPECIES: TrbC/VirB2 family protein [Campylobacter]MBC3780913.1 TrbC/VirB2 family protein [Campylobacter fetus subsp. fetus]MBC3782931.1 TrbC/VirB2 family protein [Campylobacter fetus subsp. venerealis]MBK3499233.1 TrbC/VirB2 family protein [Campylobacter fetus subsp. venerealis]MBK3501176.1 TrbC/VirB2 family protein [Campylobacter fetus subsp. venerealis]MBK3503177.1 TrbC/VirB2 family protein [Campylobacter fetus subsp. venerealis]
MKKSFFLLGVIFISSFAFAAGGIDKVNTLAENIQTALLVAGVAILSIAIIIAGYKVMFMGSGFREVAPTLVGGVLVGSATAIAGFILN